jgi:hypothetical protein
MDGHKQVFLLAIYPSKLLASGLNCVLAHFPVLITPIIITGKNTA